jgi:hypothetical protein
MTSNAIMLADAYKETFQHNESMHVLECTHARLQSDIAKQPIFCTRVAFFKHCADLLKQAMGELEMIKNWEVFYINTNKSNYHLH